MKTGFLVSFGFHGIGEAASGYLYTNICFYLVPHFDIPYSLGVVVSKIHHAVSKCHWADEG